MGQILMVEDDPSLGASLKSYLEKEGMDITHAKNLLEASEKYGAQTDLIILDWMLPDGQGIDFLREVRKDNSSTPVIMLTARTELIDKVLGLESGANDYITKPFEPRELVARMRAQLRQSQNQTKKPEGTDFIKVGELRIDFSTRQVEFNNEMIEMTKMEFELLRLLAETPGRAFSREEILNKVWGYENYPSTRTVDTHVLQLRQKLSDDLFETIRGIGYRFKG
jgi:DNA-binding response OmpR family regulator